MVNRGVVGTLDKETLRLTSVQWAQDLEKSIPELLRKMPPPSYKAAQVFTKSLHQHQHISLIHENMINGQPAFNNPSQPGTRAATVTVKDPGKAWDVIRGSGFAESGTSALFDLNRAIIEFWRSPEYGIEPGQNFQGFFQSMPLEGKPDPEQAKVAQVMKAITAGASQAQPGPAATPTRPRPAPQQQPGLGR